MAIKYIVTRGYFREAFDADPPRGDREVNWEAVLIHPCMYPLSDSAAHRDPCNAEYLDVWKVRAEMTTGVSAIVPISGSTCPSSCCIGVSTEIPWYVVPIDTDLDGTGHPGFAGDQCDCCPEGGIGQCLCCYDASPCVSGLPPPSGREVMYEPVVYIELEEADAGSPLIHWQNNCMKCTTELGYAAFDCCLCLWRSYLRGEHDGFAIDVECDGSPYVFYVPGDSNETCSYDNGGDGISSDKCVMSFCNNCGSPCTSDCITFWISTIDAVMDCYFSFCIDKCQIESDPAAPDKKDGSYCCDSGVTIGWAPA